MATPSPLTLKDLSNLSLSDDAGPSSTTVSGAEVAPSLDPRPATAMPLCVPPELWGLCPMFRCHWKMYVADLLRLPANPLHPGSFHYRGHPVSKVEVQGIVVAARQSQKFCTYSLDDGTGVISCVCWNPAELQTTTANRLSNLAAELGPELSGKVHELQDLSEAAHDPYCLGDLLRVRGRLRVFREQREITCHWYAKQADPNEEALWMLELPQIYGAHYDPGIRLPERVSHSTGVGGQVSQQAVKELLMQCQIQNALASYLKESGSVVTTVGKLSKVAEVMDIVQAGNLDGSSVKHIVEKTISQLMSLGHIFPKTSSCVEYVVTENSADLKETVLQILKADCQKPKYAEHGCHYKHVLDELKKTVQYASLTNDALLQCLSTLEASSQIISISEKHYMCFSV